MKHKQRIKQLEESTATQTPLTKEEYQAKHETFNKRKVELLGYSENDLIPFNEKMYQKYLERFRQGTKTTNQVRQKAFKQALKELRFK